MIDWATFHDTLWDFADPEGPFLAAVSPERVNANLTALTTPLPPLETWYPDFADLFALPLPPADSLERDSNALTEAATQRIIAQGQADAETHAAAIAEQFARTEAALNAPIPSVFAVAPLKFGQGYDSVLGTSLNVSGAPATVGGDDFIAYATYRPYPGLGVTGTVADDKGNAVVASGVFSGDKDADGHYILTPATQEQRAAIAVGNAAAVPAITEREIALNAGLELGGIVLPALGGLAASVSRGVRAAITADEALVLPKPTGVTVAPLMSEPIAAGNLTELPPASGLRKITPQFPEGGTQAIGQAAADPLTAAPAGIVGRDAQAPVKTPEQAAPPPPTDGGTGVTNDTNPGILKNENGPNTVAAGEVAKRGRLTDAQIADILATPKGLRPDPSEYLSPDQIQSQLAQFDAGASRFSLGSTVNKYGPAQVDGTTFVIPASQADELLASTRGEAVALEQALGLPEGTLESQNLVRIDIPNPRALNLRIPSGNEAGANAQFIPGGRLPNGNLEAVIDLGNAPSGNYNVSHVEASPIAP
ncbi:MAG: hypothetical protein WCC64_01235 [Aliidongia sp.]